MGQFGKFPEIPSIPVANTVCSIGTFWGGGITVGDLDQILLKAVKSLSSDGAGVGGVLGCLLWVVGE